MATTNKNFKVKNGLDLPGPLGVGSTPDYGTTGQILVSGGTGVAPTWENPSAGGGGISNIVEDTTPQLGGDLDAQSYDITSVNAISLDTSNIDGSTETAEIAWSTDFETIEFKLNSDVTLQIGQEHLIRVKNASGSVAIPDRTAVMFAGATGDTVTVAPAVSNDLATHPSDYLVGITTQEIPADGFGFVTQFGFINGVDTSDWTVGTLLYVDPANPGQFVTSRPAAPSWGMPIAAVTRQDAGTGRILVRAIPGAMLDKLSDVNIDTPGNNDVIAYDSTSGAWVNKTAEEAELKSGVFDGYAKYSIADIQQKTASYTLVLTDASDMIEVNSGSASIVTVPTNASVAFPVKTEIHVLQTGSGQVSFAGDTGVTVNGTPGLNLRSQWSMATLIKRDTDAWVVVGDLS